nr:hypothetical protein [uncultured Sphaerochaeta sp.]
MRRPIRSLLIVGYLIAMTLFLIGCEEEIVVEPQGEIWVYVITNENAQYTIKGIYNEDPNAEESFIMEGTSDEVNNPDTFSYFTHDWFEAKEYFQIQFIPYGDWEITVTENMIGDEISKDEEGNSEHENLEKVSEPEVIIIDSSNPVTLTFDFATS